MNIFMGTLVVLILKASIRLYGLRLYVQTIWSSEQVQFGTWGIKKLIGSVLVEDHFQIQNIQIIQSKGQKNRTMVCFIFGVE